MRRQHEGADHRFRERAVDHRHPQLRGALQAGTARDVQERPQRGAGGARQRGPHPVVATQPRHRACHVALRGLPRRRRQLSARLPRGGRARSHRDPERPGVVPPRGRDGKRVGGHRHGHHAVEQHPRARHRRARQLERRHHVRRPLRLRHLIPLQHRFHAQQGCHLQRDDALRRGLPLRRRGLHEGRPHLLPPPAYRLPLFRQRQLAGAAGQQVRPADGGVCPRLPPPVRHHARLRHRRAGDCPEHGLYRLTFHPLFAEPHPRGAADNQGHPRSRHHQLAPAASEQVVQCGATPDDALHGT